jgi:hypothetical protein
MANEKIQSKQVISSNKNVTTFILPLILYPLHLTPS